MASRLRRLAVLIWKNTVLVRSRHWIIALLEILVPLALFTLMASIRANSADFGSVVVKDHKYYEPHNQLEYNNKLRDKVIHYAPTNNFTKMLMSRVYNFSSPYALNEGMYATYFPGYILNFNILNHIFLLVQGEVMARKLSF